MPKAIEDSYLIEKLQEAGKIFGRVPTTQGIDSLKGFSSRATYKNHFGSWNAALRKAGFRVNLEQKIVSEVRQMSPTEAAYVAGIFDGEGCISFSLTRGKYPCCNVQIANTDLEMLETIQVFINGGRIMGHRLNGKRENFTAQYILYFRVNELADLLPQLLPYLVTKKDKAITMLTYLRGRRNC